MLINSVKIYFRNRYNLLILILALLGNLFCWLWLGLKINAKLDIVFLHYNILFGVDYIDSWGKVFYLPLLGLALIVINTFLAWWLWSKDKLISIILHSITILCQLFLIIAAILLVYLNV